MKEDAQLVCPVSYDDPASVWQLIEDDVIASLPLRDISWKSASLSSSIISISQLPLRFLPATASLFKDTDHPFRWFLAPYVNIYLISNVESVEAYRCIRARIKSWVDGFAGVKRESWLLVYAPRGTCTTTFDIYQKIYSRICSDFYTDKQGDRSVFVIHKQFVCSKGSNNNKPTTSAFGLSLGSSGASSFAASLYGGGNANHPSSPNSGSHGGGNSTTATLTSALQYQFKNCFSDLANKLRDGVISSFEYRCALYQTEIRKLDVYRSINRHPSTSPNPAGIPSSSSSSSSFSQHHNTPLRASTSSATPSGTPSPPPSLQQILTQVDFKQLFLVRESFSLLFQMLTLYNEALNQLLELELLLTFCQDVQHQHSRYMHMHNNEIEKCSSATVNALLDSQYPIVNTNARQFSSTSSVTSGDSRMTPTSKGGSSTLPPLPMSNSLHSPPPAPALTKWRESWTDASKYGEEVLLYSINSVRMRVLKNKIGLLELYRYIFARIIYFLTMMGKKPGYVAEKGMSFLMYIRKSIDRKLHKQDSEAYRVMQQHIQRQQQSDGDENPTDPTRSTGMGSNSSAPTLTLYPTNQSLADVWLITSSMKIIQYAMVHQREEFDGLMGGFTGDTNRGSGVGDSSVGGIGSSNAPSGDSLRLSSSSLPMLSSQNGHRDFALGSTPYQIDTSKHILNLLYYSLTRLVSVLAPSSMKPTSQQCALTQSRESSPSPPPTSLPPPPSAPPPASILLSLFAIVFEMTHQYRGWKAFTYSQEKPSFPAMFPFSYAPMKTDRERKCARFIAASASATTIINSLEESVNTYPQKVRHMLRATLYAITSASGSTNTTPLPYMADFSLIPSIHMCNNNCGVNSVSKYPNSNSNIVNSRGFVTAQQCQLDSLLFILGYTVIHNLLAHRMRFAIYAMVKCIDIQIIMGNFVQAYDMLHVLLFPHGDDMVDITNESVSVSGSGSDLRGTSEGSENGSSSSSNKQEEDVTTKGTSSKIPRITIDTSASAGTGATNTATYDSVHNVSLSWNDRVTQWVLYCTSSVSLQYQSASSTKPSFTFSNTNSPSSCHDANVSEGRSDDKVSGSQQPVTEEGGANNTVNNNDNDNGNSNSEKSLPDTVKSSSVVADDVKFMTPPPTPDLTILHAALLQWHKQRYLLLRKMMLVCRSLGYQTANKEVTSSASSNSEVPSLSMNQRDMLTPSTGTTVAYGRAKMKSTYLQTCLQALELLVATDEKLDCTMETVSTIATTGASIGAPICAGESNDSDTKTNQRMLLDDILHLCEHSDTKVPTEKQTYDITPFPPVQYALHPMMDVAVPISQWNSPLKAVNTDNGANRGDEQVPNLSFNRHIMMDETVRTAIVQYPTPEIGSVGATPKRSLGNTFQLRICSKLPTVVAVEECFVRFQAFGVPTHSSAEDLPCMSEEELDNEQDQDEEKDEVIGVVSGDGGISVACEDDCIDYERTDTLDRKGVGSEVITDMGEPGLVTGQGNNNNIKSLDELLAQHQEKGFVNSANSVGNDADGVDGVDTTTPSESIMQGSVMPHMVFHSQASSSTPPINTPPVTPSKKATPSGRFHPVRPTDALLGSDAQTPLSAARPLTPGGDVHHVPNMHHHTHITEESSSHIPPIYSSILCNGNDSSVNSCCVLFNNNMHTCSRYEEMKKIDSHFDCYPLAEVGSGSDGSDGSDHNLNRTTPQSQPEGNCYDEQGRLLIFPGEQLLTFHFVPNTTGEFVPIELSVRIGSNLVLHHNFASQYSNLTDYFHDLPIFKVVTRLNNMLTDGRDIGEGDDQTGDLLTERGDNTYGDTKQVGGGSKGQDHLEDCDKGLGLVLDTPSYSPTYSTNTAYLTLHTSQHEYISNMCIFVYSEVDNDTDSNEDGGDSCVGDDTDPPGGSVCDGEDVADGDVEDQQGHDDDDDANDAAPSNNRFQPYTPSRKPIAGQGQGQGLGVNTPMNLPGSVMGDDDDDEEREQLLKWKEKQLLLLEEEEERARMEELGGRGRTSSVSACTASPRVVPSPPSDWSISITANNRHTNGATTAVGMETGTRDTEHGVSCDDLVLWTEEGDIDACESKSADTRIVYTYCEETVNSGDIVATGPSTAGRRKRCRLVGFCISLLVPNRTLTVRIPYKVDITTHIGGVRGMKHMYQASNIPVQASLPLHCMVKGVLVQQLVIDCSMSRTGMCKVEEEDDDINDTNGEVGHAIDTPSSTSRPLNGSVGNVYHKCLVPFTAIKASQIITGPCIVPVDSRHTMTTAVGGYPSDSCDRHGTKPTASTRDNTHSSANGNDNNTPYKRLKYSLSLHQLPKCVVSDASTADILKKECLNNTYWQSCEVTSGMPCGSTKEQQLDCVLVYRIVEDMLYHTICTNISPMDVTMCDYRLSLLAASVPSDNSHPNNRVADDHNVFVYRNIPATTQTISSTTVSPVSVCCYTILEGPGDEDEGYDDHPASASAKDGGCHNTVHYRLCEYLPRMSDGVNCCSYHAMYVVRMVTLVAVPTGHGDDSSMGAVIHQQHQPHYHHSRTRTCSSGSLYSVRYDDETVGMVVQYAYTSTYGRQPHATTAISSICDSEVQFILPSSALTVNDVISHHYNHKPRHQQPHDTSPITSVAGSTTTTPIPLSIPLSIRTFPLPMIYTQLLFFLEHELQLHGRILHEGSPDTVSRATSMTPVDEVYDLSEDDLVYIQYEIILGDANEEEEEEEGLGLGLGGDDSDHNGRISGNTKLQYVHSLLCQMETLLAEEETGGSNHKISGSGGGGMEDNTTATAPPITVCIQFIPQLTALFTPIGHTSKTIYLNSTYLSSCLRKHRRKLAGAKHTTGAGAGTDVDRCSRTHHDIQRPVGKGVDAVLGVYHAQCVCNRPVQRSLCNAPPLKVRLFPSQNSSAYTHSDSSVYGDDHTLTLYPQKPSR